MVLPVLSAVPFQFYKDGPVGVMVTGGLLGVHPYYLIPTNDN